jgi:hypothetical protein
MNDLNIRRAAPSRTFSILVALVLVVSGCAPVATHTARFLLVAVTERGLDAFFQSGNTDIGLTSSSEPGGAVDGNAPGLYGGTRNAAKCSPTKLIGFLDAEPDKAKAWASVYGIKVREIPAFIRRLTPVILRRDTVVKNHGFKKGKANAISAVLQAGMAVLVDGAGTPRVKCNCGNPLTDSTDKLDDRAEITLSEQSRDWGFKREQAVIVRKSTRRVKSITLVQPGTEMAFERQVGTDGTADGTLVQAPPEPVAQPDPMIPMPSPPTSTTSVPDEAPSLPTTTPSASIPTPSLPTAENTAEPTTGIAGPVDTTIRSG